MARPRSAWWMAAVLYGLVVLARVAPSATADRIMATFHVNAQALGALSSLQFLVYVAMQIPAGLLSDRFGPGPVLLAGALVAGIGNLMVGVSPSFAGVLAGRFLDGLGDSVVWVNALMLQNALFPPQRMGRLTATLNAMGTAGNLVGTVPLAVMAGATGVRLPYDVMGAMLVALFVVALPSLRMVRASGLRLAPVRATLARVVRRRRTWPVVMVHFGAVGSTVILGGVWGLPFLMQAYGQPRAQAASVLLAGTLAGMIGGITAGRITDRTWRRRLPFGVVLLWTLGMWGLMSFAPGPLPLAVLVTAILSVFFAGGFAIMSFAVVRETSSREEVGVASGLTNMGGFTSAVLMGPLIGAQLDASWRGATLAGSPAFPLLGYQMAFRWPMAGLALSLLGALMLPEALRPQRPAPPESR